MAKKKTKHRRTTRVCAVCGTVIGRLVAEDGWMKFRPNSKCQVPVMNEYRCRAHPEK